MSAEGHGLRALQSRVNRDQAVRAFTRGLGGAVRRVALGPVRSIAEVYVPFLPFEVVIKRPRGDERVVLGIDAVSATLDLYRFDGSASAELVHVPIRNRLGAIVSPAVAHRTVVARLQRIIYQRAGFLAAGAVDVQARAIGEPISIPYWIGFFGRREAASLVVMDGVRGQIEGAKAKRLIAQWLAS